MVVTTALEADLAEVRERARVTAADARLAESHLQEAATALDGHIAAARVLAEWITYVTTPEHLPDEIAAIVRHYTEADDE